VQDFEERLYVASDWITTRLDSKETVDILAANKRLKDYCQRQKEAGRSRSELFILTHAVVWFVMLIALVVYHTGKE